MKNTKMRKKMLLSSIAMLMVATVSLGSATYAWFTSNPNATAKGLTLKATASKGLMIRTESHGGDTFWGHDDYLNCNDAKNGTKADKIPLTPVSFDLKTADTLGAAYTVDAEKSSASGALATNKVSSATGGIATGSYYQENIYCKVTGSETGGVLKLNGITFTPNADLDMDEGLRIAIEYTPSSGTKKLIGVYALAPTAQKNNYMTLTQGETFTSGTTTYDKFEKNEKTFALPPATLTTLGDVGTDGTDVVTVTIYLDGEDDKVYSDAVSVAELISDINVNLKVVEPDPAP